jgi:DNA-binding NarL/FixJ family response regulator
MTHSVLLVEDHKLVRDGIKAILAGTPEFTVVGDVSNGMDAVRAVATSHPDLVLMGVALPGIDGIESSAAILRHSPATRVVMLSMREDEGTVIAAFRAGVRAYVSKKSSSVELLTALRTVLRGGLYLGREVSEHLRNRILRGDWEPMESCSPLASLTQRELQVLRLVAKGKTTKDIAAMLDVRPSTLSGYRKSLMKKLGAGNIADLTRAAIKAGLAFGPTILIEFPTPGF